MTTSEAFKRGVRDAARGRSPLFRSTKARGIVADVDDQMADEWDEEARRAYLRGYEEG